MVPEGWRKRSLEDVAHIQTGVAKGKKNIVDPVEKPYLRVANVQDGHLDMKEIKLIEVARKDVTRYSLQHGDIVLTEGGDFDKLGRGTMWQSQLPECLHQNHVFAVRVDREQLLPEFFSAQTNSSYGKGYFLSCAKRSTNLASINSTQLKQFPALVPPLPEQRKIADILSTWDAAIEKTEALLATAKAQKRALMQSLLTGRRRFPEFEGQEWKEVRLGDLGATFNGLTGKTKDDFGEGYPFIPYMNIFANSRIDVSHVDYVSVGHNERQSRIQFGDLFFTTSSETPNEVGMSSVMLDEMPDLFLNSFCFGFRLHDFESMRPRFARFFLRGQDFRRSLHRLAQGATRYNLSKTNLMNTKLVLPPVDEQEQITDTLEIAQLEEDELRKEVTKLRTEKKALMQQLLTGKRRVVV